MAMLWERVKKNTCNFLAQLFEESVAHGLPQTAMARGTARMHTTVGSPLLPPLLGWPCASYKVSFGLNFLTCKLGIIVVAIS